MQQPGKPASRKRRQSNDPPRRSTVACDRCRGRKTRCAGPYPGPCAACIDAQQPCIYSNLEKRVSVPESYLLKLQVQAGNVNPPGQEPSASPVEGVSRDVDFDAFPGTDNWVAGRKGEYYYMGNSSSTYIANRLNPTTETLAWHLYPHHEDATWLRRPVSTELPPLPPYEFAKRLFAAQHAYIGTIFSFVSEERFHERVTRVYARPPDLTDKEDCLVYCQVLLVLALGQMYSVNQWTGNEGPPGFLYFKHAIRFLPDVHEDGSILFVEVLCYVAYYMQSLNRRDAAYLYLGLATRMAISLGLHQEPSEQDLGAFEREHRRRTWWSTYSLDRLFCVTAGHPISIHDDDVDVSLPGPVGNEDPRCSSILRLYTQLSMILGRIGKEIYRRNKRSGASLVVSIQNITNSLSEWFQQLPPELRLESSDFEKEVRRETISLYLYYYQCINLTARPLLLYAVQRQMAAAAQGSPMTQWETGLPPDVVNVVHAAIAASRSSTYILKSASKFNLVATYGFIDGEQAFSAALLLVMVNIAFPYNEADASALDTSLASLQSMAERGNRYIRACHSILTKIRNAIRDRVPVPVSRPGPTSAGSLVMKDMENQEQTQQPMQQHTQPQTQQQEQIFYPTQHNLVPPPPSSHFNPVDLPSSLDISQMVNLDDDTGLWTDVLDSIGIDMDRNWIESTLLAGKDLSMGQVSHYSGS